MQIIETVPGGGRRVSLTFDDGPDPEHTPRLLSVLRRHRVRAVFCLLGRHVDAHPDLLRRIAAAGHPIGNHSMRHDDVSTWSRSRIEAELRETNATIHRALPDASIPYYRAPYGRWGESPQVAVGLGMRPLGWRLAVGDWEPPGADELVRRIHTGVTPGAVVLLHDGGGDRGDTVEAVDRAIPILRADGWRFTLP